MIFLSEGTIPSSFAGLPEFPDQFVAGLLQESLNALRTRNDGSTPADRPLKGTLFSPADRYSQSSYPFLRAGSSPHQVCSSHPTRSDPGCKGCPTASRSLSLASRIRPGKKRCCANPIDEVMNSGSTQK